LWFIPSPSEVGDFNHDDLTDQADYDFWRANFGATSGIGLQADGNRDGVVDAADYTIWRDTLGSMPDLQSDGSGPVVGPPDEVVDGLDYDFWKARFGNVIGGGAGGGGQGAGSGGIDKETGRQGDKETGSVVASVGDSIDFSPQAEGKRSTAGQARQWHLARGTADRRDEALAAWVVMHNGNGQSVSATADLRSETPPTTVEDKFTDEEDLQSAVDDAFAGLELLPLLATASPERP
jgi:hypothetical protein